MLALVGTLDQGVERPGPAGGACIPLAFKSARPWGAIYLLPEPAPPPDVPSLPFTGLFGTLAAGAPAEVAYEEEIELEEEVEVAA